MFIILQSDTHAFLNLRDLLQKADHCKGKVLKNYNHKHIRPFYRKERY